MVQIIRAAVAHSKLRKTIGLVVVMGDSDTRQVKVGFAREWKRKAINSIAPEIKKIHKKIDWDTIIMDQLSGQHFIDALHKRAQLGVKVITTQKNLKDPKELENLEVMDKVEITQFFMTLKLNHQIIFPGSKDKILKDMEDQLPIFTEHITESGTVDYYAAGEEPDDLIKALLFCCFSLRNILQGEEPSHGGGRAFNTPRGSLVWDSPNLNKYGLEIKDF